MQINILIESNEPNLLQDLFGKNGGEEEKVIADNATIKCGHIVEKLSAETSASILLIVEITKDIAIALFSTWLYNKLTKKNIKTVKIEEEEVLIEKGEIKKIITRKYKEEN